MDPIAHSLVGASLSETPLKRLSVLASPTLVLAANAPDIDIVSAFVGRDLSLQFRRGWTHGVLAMAILPLLLAGLILLADRCIASVRRRPPKARFGPTLVLSYIGVWTHPILDWLNTYGVRLLMPFDGRWFYGDALFIIDPWVWLLAGAVVVLANTKSAISQTTWLIFGIATTALVTGVSVVPATARWTWIAGIAVIVGLRISGQVHTQLPRVAIACLTCIAVYAGSMAVGSHLATRQVSQWLSDRGSDSSVIMAGPLPANPFVRDVIILDESHYHFLELNWLRSDPFQITGPAIPRGPNTPIINAALKAPSIKGLMTWIRFPAYSVNAVADGYIVTIQDVRYARRNGLGIGTVTVELDHDLTIKPSM